MLSMGGSDRWWAELCALHERDDLVNEERYSTAAARSTNNEGRAAELDANFRRRALDEWQRRLEGFGGAWGPVLDPREIHDHPRARPNGFLHMLVAHDGVPVCAVAPPLQLDGMPTRPAGRAPEPGEQTAEILAELDSLVS